MTATRIGLLGLNMGAAAEPAVAARLAQLAEELGYESLWVGEHAVLPSPSVPPSRFAPDYPFADPFTTLGFLAAQTDHVLLGTGVLLLSQHHPVHVAKQAATVDRLSGGRFILGVGVGYLDCEFAALGVPMADRGRRVSEYIAALRTLWGPGPVHFDGEFVRLAGIDAAPRPVQPAGPAIVVGGHSPSALARAGRLGDGWFGFHLEPEQVARRVATVQAHARASGRAPLEINVAPARRLDAALIEAYAGAGVDRLILVPGMDLDGERLERFVRLNAPASFGVTSPAGHAPPGGTRAGPADNKGGGVGPGRAPV